MAPVHEAAEDNDVATLEGLLDLWPLMIEVQKEETEGTARGGSPLHIACYCGSLDAARLLLDRGAAIDARDDHPGETPFMVACEQGFAELVGLLLRRGADPTLRSETDGWTTLMCASFAWEEREGEKANSPRDHVAVLRLLLEDGRVPVNARDAATGATAFWLACCVGCIEEARVLLLEGGADHTLVGGEGGKTPMDVAKKHCWKDCVKLLQWYEGELHRAYLLSKARAVADATHVAKAMEKHAKSNVGVKTLNQQASPACLHGRVASGEALPEVELVGRRVSRRLKEKRVAEAERRAVLEHVVCGLNTDLFLDLMAGLRYHNG